MLSFICSVYVHTYSKDDPSFLWYESESRMSNGNVQYIVALEIGYFQKYLKIHLAHTKKKN